MDPDEVCLSGSCTSQPQTLLIKALIVFLTWHPSTICPPNLESLWGPTFDAGSHNFKRAHSCPQICRYHPKPPYITLWPFVPANPHQAWPLFGRVKPTEKNEIHICSRWRRRRTWPASSPRPKSLSSSARTASAWAASTRRAARTTGIPSGEFHRFGG